MNVTHFTIKLQIYKYYGNICRHFYNAHARRILEGIILRAFQNFLKNPHGVTYLYGVFAEY